MRCCAVRAAQLQLPRGTVSRSAQGERKKRSFDVTNGGVQTSKMAEVSGLRSRNHFEPNCQSRAADEGKPPPVWFKNAAGSRLGGRGVDSTRRGCVFVVFVSGETLVFFR